MLIATCLLPLGAVALEETLQSNADLRIEADRVAAHSTEWAMPCLWATGSDADSVDASIASDPSVERVVTTQRFDGETFYHLEWSGAVTDRIDAYLDEHATVLSAEADADGWTLQMRFADRSQFDSFREHVDEAGHSFRLLQLTEPGEARRTVGGLTPEQLETLRTAVEEGYYRVPREITTRDLAERLGSSHQSVSELLRRGTENLVTAMLARERGGPPEESRDEGADT